MLKLLTDLTLVARHDYDASAWVLASGKTGTFVCHGGSNDVVQPTAGNFAIPVWSESNRDETAGWSPDIAATGKVSTLYGKLRGVTDQYIGTPAVGDPLYVDANGKLTTVSAGNAVVIAYCTRAAYSDTYLSKLYTVIEFVTA